MPVWTERQRPPWYFSLAIVSGCIVFGIVVLVLIFSTNLPPRAAAILVIAWLAAALVDGLIASLGLVSDVYPDRLDVYFTPLHFPCRKILWEEIETIYSRSYSPLEEYGGWGIRRGKSGSAYNLKGSQGIQVELKDGRKFLIGTQQPDAFMQAVKSVYKKAAD